RTSVTVQDTRRDIRIRLARASGASSLKSRWLGRIPGGEGIIPVIAGMLGSTCPCVRMIVESDRMGRPYVCSGCGKVSGTAKADTSSGTPAYIASRQDDNSSADVPLLLKVWGAIIAGLNGLGIALTCLNILLTGGATAIQGLVSVVISFVFL